MPTIELVDLEKFGSALKSIAEAVAALGDSVAHLVGLGVQGWDAAAARRTQARLIEMRKHLITYSRSQGVAALSIEDYITRIEGGRAPRQADWLGATRHLLPLMTEVRSLFAELDAEKSAFVLDDAYERLHDTLDARLTLFQRLRDADAPRSPEQIEALRRIMAEWSRLREELSRASDLLVAYLREANQRN